MTEVVRGNLATTIPGGGGTFSTPDTPRITDSGRVAFGAYLGNVGPGGGGGYGLFTNAGGALQTLAYANGFGTAGTFAPGTGERFVAFSQVLINEAGRTAFIGYYGSSSTTGLFAADAGGALTALALPGTTVLPGAGTLVSIDIVGLALNAGGQMVFKATGTTGAGVFLRESDGTLRVVALHNTPWDIDGDGPGTATGTIAGTTLAGTFSGNASGLATFLNDAGQVSLTIHFGDGLGMSGLYVVNFAPVPEPAHVLAVAAGVLALGTWARRHRRRPTTTAG